MTSRGLGIIAFFRRWVEKPEEDRAQGCLLATSEIQDALEDYDEVAQWKAAVDDACVIAWVPMTTPRETIRALLLDASNLALDPAVSEEAAGLHARIGELERELKALVDAFEPVCFGQKRYEVMTMAQNVAMEMAEKTLRG